MQHTASVSASPAPLAHFQKFFVEGEPFLEPGTWRRVGFSDERGRELNDCDSVEKAQSVLQDMRRLMVANPADISWQNLRVVQQDTHTFLVQPPVPVRA